VAAIVGREPRVAVAAIVGPGAERVGAMKVLRTVAEVRAALGGARRAGRVVGLIPTMGAFHEGHLSLMRRAREECGAVVVSLFVNPSQFTEAGDLAVYPRDELRDAMLAAEVGVDHLFAPRHDEIYPPGFVTMVSTSGVATTLEGAHRGHGHFDAVTTIVTKLFNIVSPDVAYFGRKDIQQAHVIERVARDLNLAVRIAVCPTVREPDGLAMSSRNVHLSPAQRQRAGALYRALAAAQRSVAAGARHPGAVAASARSELRAGEVEPEYLELVDPDTLTPVQRIEGDVLALIAARIGTTRLIDNQLLCAAGAGPRAGTPPEGDARGFCHPAAAASTNHGRR